MAIVTFGIDLANNFLAMHSVNESGKPEFMQAEVSRAKLLEIIANLPPCLIGKEAYSGDIDKFGSATRRLGGKPIPSHEHTLQIR